MAQLSSSPRRAAPEGTAGAPLQLYAADWVLPAHLPPIRDGVVVVEGPRIAWVGERREVPSRYLKARIRAFPRSLLLPGWVNSHTHLHLTAALGRLSTTQDRAVEWLVAVEQLLASLPPEVVRQSVTAGLDLLLSTGTTTTVHVSPFPAVEPFLERPLRTVLLHEASGLSRGATAEAVAGAVDWLQGARTLLADAGSDRVHLGLAVESLATTNPALLRSVAELAAAEGVPFSLHLPGSAAEEQFLQFGTGPFPAWLAARYGRAEAGRSPGRRPAQELAGIGPGLAVLGMPPAAPELELLAEQGWSVVYCPGSRRHLGQPVPTLLSFVRAGGRLVLGTESLASNVGLTMLRELRLAAADGPELSPDYWLRAATLGGAEALGLGACTGSLEPGKAADLQVLGPLPDGAKEPWGPLLAAPLGVRLLLAEGEEVRIR
ncbi:MAG: amidohydrolase family protein [Armatimonadetes bacterium]|nr:amidohydrolase family protein [Armatimonadota bacterium]